MKSLKLPLLFIVVPIDHNNYFAPLGGKGKKGKKILQFSLNFGPQVGWKIKNMQQSWIFFFFLFLSFVTTLARILKVFKWHNMILFDLIAAANCWILTTETLGKLGQTKDWLKKVKRGH